MAQTGEEAEFWFSVDDACMRLSYTDLDLDLADAGKNAKTTANIKVQGTR